MPLLVNSFRGFLGMEISEIKHKYKLEFKGDYMFSTFRDRLPDFKRLTTSERRALGMNSNEYYRYCKRKQCARSGVYFLYNESNELIYIGASINLGQRCEGRIGKGRVVMYVTNYNPFEIEKKLIRNYKPKRNIIQYIHNEI